MLDFTLTRDTDIVVTLVSPGAPMIRLAEIAPSDEDMPVWARVTPPRYSPLDDASSLRGRCIG